MSGYEEVINKLKNELEKGLSKVEPSRIKLFAQSWLDDYNGRPGRETYVYGIKITRNDNEELLNLVTKMLRIVHNDMYIHADFIAITEDGIYIQWHADAVNSFGNYVGTEYRYEKLDDVLRKFKKIESNLPEREELMKKLKDLINNI